MLSLSIMYLSYHSTAVRMRHTVLSGVKLVRIQFFFLSVCLTKAKEPSLPYYLPIDGVEEMDSSLSLRY